MLTGPDVGADASRRILREPEHDIGPDALAQPVDVDVRLSPRARVPVPGLPGYHSVGVAAAADQVRHGVELGMTEFVVRFVGTSADSSHGSADGPARPAEALADLRERLAGGPATLIVDPFGVALNADGTWGRAGPAGLDADLTTTLVEDLAAAMARAGADGIVTLGRLPQEVPATRRGITRAGTETKIYSFSQNSETSTAYVYLNGSQRDTGQKILPGNTTEMDLWSLLDIWDGTDVCLVKPMENFHVAGNLRRLLDDDVARTGFITSTGVRRLAALRPPVADRLAAMAADPRRMARRCRAVRIGTYAVSGTTALLGLLAERHGTALARARLREMWLNSAAATGARRGPLVDRNATSYLDGGILF